AASSGSNVSIGLQWNQPEEETGFNRNDASIIRSDGTTIVQKSAAGAANGTNPYAMAGSGFSTLTQFSVGTNTMVPLPLQLISFSAQWINDAAAGLSWTVDPQSPVAAYTVQRSTDGLRYTDIGTVTATTGRTSYSYIDTRPSTNNSYRLLLKTPGGNTAYSRIVQLSENTTADRAALAPSVTERSSTSLLLSLNQASDVLYTLSDISGHIMTHYAVRLAGGDHNLPLDISRLPAGVYFVRVTGSDGLNKTLTLIRR
ncbi:MAG: T9SS type A sorting domain-containing protein, partial [Chitinophaga rupis]